MSSEASQKYNSAIDSHDGRVEARENLLPREKAARIQQLKSEKLSQRGSMAGFRKGNDFINLKSFH